MLSAMTAMLHDRQPLVDTGWRLVPFQRKGLTAIAREALAEVSHPHLKALEGTLRLHPTLGREFGSNRIELPVGPCRDGQPPPLR